MNNFISGPNAVLEALEENIKILQIYLCSGIQNPKASNIKQIARKKGIRINDINKSDLEKLAGRKTQGIVAIVPEFKYSQIDSIKGERVLALDSVKDPQNLGACIRSAAAFGVREIIITKHKSASVTPAVWKASAGQVGKVKIVRVTSLANALDYLKKENYFVVGTNANAKSKISDNPFRDEKLIIVMGSEDKGISRLVLEKCDIVSSIPMSGNVESLNISVSAAIALYELSKK
ncbi:MAG: 23S rRNA (guanosine(2251)-2'-O)-methyltransferase RlmB [Bifidobacteriaceae bacterium]|jgi:23S rRNA (guanosine2251-2'-O)-methyltransferase|nr:23S rRNA (guanosine(2251)-2'-O)-methyltransferase RlmB [Bifidobacteriaceae bacterium]